MFMYVVMCPLLNKVQCDVKYCECCCNIHTYLLTLRQIQSIKLTQFCISQVEGNLTMHATPNPFAAATAITTSIWVWRYLYLGLALAGRVAVGCGCDFILVCYLNIIYLSIWEAAILFWFATLIYIYLFFGRLRFYFGFLPSIYLILVEAVGGSIPILWSRLGGGFI